MPKTEKQGTNGWGRWVIPLLLGCVISFAKGGAQSVAPMPNLSEEYLKTAADRERAALGLPPLRFDAALSAAAHTHAVLMVEHNSISHQYAQEPDLANRAKTAGARFSLITENVAQAPDAMQIHTAWMNSKGHRHNLLDQDVDSVGIAVISRHGQLFAVEDFARAVAPLSIRQQEVAVAEEVQAVGIVIDQKSGDARQECAGGPTSGMISTPDFVMRYTTDNLNRLPAELTARLRNGGYSHAGIGACAAEDSQFTMYRVAVLLYRRSVEGAR